MIWEFPKIRGTLFWGPYTKDIQGTILGSPIFGTPPHNTSTYDVDLFSMREDVSREEQDPVIRLWLAPPRFWTSLM